MDNDTEKTNGYNKIAAFDCTYTSNHIRMLKIILYYIPENYRRYLIIYIKYLELQQAFSASPTLSADTVSCAAEYTDHFQKSFDFSSLIHELMPFCNSREKQQFQNMENMLNSFEQLKSMMEMFEMMKDMKDMFGDGEGGFDPEMLAGMMGGMDGFDFTNMFNK